MGAGVRPMEQKSKILRQYGDTDFITGLRAIAATMVIVIHTGAFRDFGQWGQAVTDAGKYGVDIFFVISGFTIAKTFNESRDYKSYLVRRMVRIVPLYWFMISIAMLLWASGNFSLPYWMIELNSEPNLYNLAMHFSMLSYLDYRVANSVMGVEWTIPIEVFWYVCLPSALWFALTIFRTVTLMFFMLIITAALSYLSKEMLGTSLPIQWSPIAHGHLFMLGALAFHLRGRFKSYKGKTSNKWIAAAVCLFTIALLFDFNGRSAILAISTAIMIVWLTPIRASWVTRPLTTPPMLFVGSISYSMYLVHMFVIHILHDLGWLPDAGHIRFILIFGVTVLLSTLTYLLIEKPTNQYGRKLVKSL